MELVFFRNGVAVIFLVPAFNQRAIIRAVILIGIAEIFSLGFLGGETKVSVVKVGYIVTGVLGLRFRGKGQGRTQEVKNRRQNNRPC